LELSPDPALESEAVEPLSHPSYAWTIT